MLALLYFSRQRMGVQWWRNLKMNGETVQWDITCWEVQDWELEEFLELLGILYAIRNVGKGEDYWRRTLAANGSLRVKDYYLILAGEANYTFPRRAIWSTRAPTKVSLFFLLLAVRLGLRFSLWMILYDVGWLCESLLHAPERCRVSGAFVYSLSGRQGSLVQGFESGIVPTGMHSICVKSVP